MGVLASRVQKYAPKKITFPGKDYLEHILEGWCDALRSARRQTEDKNERKKEFERIHEYADTTAIDCGNGRRIWRPDSEIRRGVGESRGGGFPPGGSHSPGAGVQSGPAARVWSAYGCAT